MRYLLKELLISVMVVAGTAAIVPGLRYGDGFTTLVVSALVLWLMHLVLLPFLKLLLVPFTIITLGLASGLAYLVLLYLTTLLVPGFEVVGFAWQLGSTTVLLSSFWAYAATAAVLFILWRILHWILR